MITQMNFKYRIYPSQKQIIKLNKTLSDCCFVYNKLLETKINAYKTDKTNLSKFDLDKLTKQFDVPVHSQVKQNISKRINDAFNHFFRRVKLKKGKVGFPRFKNLNRYKSITYPQSGFKIVSERKLFVSQIGNIPIVLDRVPKGKLKTFCIKKTAIGWFAIFSCSDVPVEKIEVPDNQIGIDVGIENFATLSNGEVIANPALLKKSEKKLAKLQRRFSRKKKGSANRRKARFRVARLHETIFNQRSDFLHKTSFSVIKRFKIISVEKLQINNMVKNHHLAKSINDVSWGIFIQMLSYKVERTGGQLVKVNPRNTSKTCSNCGTILDMPLSKRKFKCLNCGFVCHRDLNASININTAGRAEINACEHDVRPSSVKAVVDEAGTIFEPA
ncbi:MAG: transposase [Nanoarchaeota archaeon]|nr:transposase [Nanoarchaeota archaeon]